MRVNALALQRDEAAASVGRGDGDFDRFAGAVLVAGEMDLEFGVFFERARDRSLANNRVFQAADPQMGGVAQFHDEVAGRGVSGKTNVEAAPSNGSSRSGYSRRTDS